MNCHNCLMLLYHLNEWVKLDKSFHHLEFYIAHAYINYSVPENCNVKGFAMCMGASWPA